MIPRAQRLAKITDTLSVRPYKPEDYHIAQKWWMQHNKKYLSKDILSPLGVVVEQMSAPVAMGWLYLSNAALAQFGWMVTKPKMGPKTRLMALTLLLDHAERAARKTGYRALQMFSDQPALNRIARAQGFEVVNAHEFLFKVLGDDDDV